MTARDLRPHATPSGMATATVILSSAVSGQRPPVVSTLTLALALAIQAVPGIGPAHAAELAATAAVQSATQVQAGDRQARYAFSIPAGDLKNGVGAFGTQTRLQLVYAPDVLQGKTTAGVAGSHTLQEALQRLLAGTGLTWEFVGATAVAIRPEAPPPVRSRPQARTRPAQEGENVVAMPAIMVQGTRTLNMDITRTEDDPQPYVVFDRETIQRSGALNLEGFLRDRLSMNANSAPNSLRITQLGAQSRFNLRGLGAGQTLILINGRRATPGPSSGSTPLQTDVNGIPLSAVERIEVLPATSSGIYGGSATGGVINIILRQDYDATEVKVTYGNTFDSDVADRRIDVSAGFNAGERTNLLLSASWSDRNRLKLRDRPELLERYYDIVRANAPNLLLPPNNPPLGFTPNIRSADGSNLVLDDGTPLNSPITHVPAGHAGGAGRGQALAANAGRYDLGLANSTQIISGGMAEISQAPRNDSLRGVLRHEFTPRVQAFLEASASEATTTGIPITSIGSFNQPFRVSASAPNNPFASDILVTVPTDSFDQLMETTVTQYRATGGLVVVLPGQWQAAADYTWGKTRSRQGGVMFSSTTAAAAAILDGTLDVLRDTNAYPVDLVRYLSATNLKLDQEIEFQDIALRLAGPVFDLPAGSVTVSGLLEYRDEEFGDATNVYPGLNLFVPGRSASATSLYLETKVPLFSEKNRRAGLDALDLQLAVRADHYRVHGKTGFVNIGSNEPIVSATNETRSVNPTVALRYQPIEDLVLRTSYGTGFVAPDVSQLAPSVYPAPLTVIDPRRGNAVTVLPIGQVVYQGNADLGPEKSRNWSIGFILTPRLVPGLRLSLDYMRIRKTDNIAGYPTSYQGIVNDEALLPGRVTRGPNLPGDPAGWAGPITLLDASLFNIARAEVEAFDVQLDYNLATDFGTFGLSTVATRQTHYQTTPLAGQPTLENVGVGYNNPQALTGNAELKWQHRAWTAGWLARYYDSYLTANPAVPGNAAHVALQGDGGRVPSQTYHDVYVNWVADLSERNLPKFLLGTEIQFGIRNAFDKIPPFDAYYYNVFRTLHSPLGDPLGRSWQIALTKRF